MAGQKTSFFFFFSKFGSEKKWTQKKTLLEVAAFFFGRATRVGAFGNIRRTEVQVAGKIFKETFQRTLKDVGCLSQAINSGSHSSLSSDNIFPSSHEL